MKKTFLFITILIVLNACTGFSINQENPKDKLLLATLNDSKLYFSDINKFRLEGLNPEDSIAVLKEEVLKWAKREALVQKAIENTIDLSNIDAQVANYRSELIKAKYEKKILASFEVELNEEELTEYYEKHKEYFILSEDYYEMNYILLPANTSNLQQIRKNISKNENSTFINSYCMSNKNKCYLDNSVLKNINELHELLDYTANNIGVSKDFNYKYMKDESVLIYKILSIRKKDEIAPLELIKNEVSQLAIHHKKEEYLFEIEEKTYQKAKNDKIFENYIN